MRVQLRIVAGRLRGRRVSCEVTPHLRPAPERLREAYFNILGDAVPDRIFYDLFAGTGIVGVEALSRGARSAKFVERDFRTAEAIESHLESFGLVEQGSVIRADVYRWAERWAGAPEPLNIFIGPPFPNFQHRFDDIIALVTQLQEKAAPGSVLALQSENSFHSDRLPDSERWEVRRYGRNLLLIWIKEAPVPAAT